MRMRDIITLIEGKQHAGWMPEVDQAISHGTLYRGVLENVADAYIKTDRMQARTVHYIPDVGRRVRGLSTSFDPALWGRRYRVTFVLNGATIPNKRWGFNGQTIYELSDHMEREKKGRSFTFNGARSTGDYLHAVKYGSVNEIFLAGDLAPISQYCNAILVRNMAGWEELERRVREYAEQHDIPVKKADY